SLQYYECTDLDWKLKTCGQGEMFSDHMKACQKGYTCAAPKTCLQGSSFLLNCRDFMYCTGSHYEACLTGHLGKMPVFTCPPNTSWSPEKKNCIVDPACKTSSFASLN
ncbi:hypothetical protein OESDEN_20622, partial [Oesophagostomum dentatum]